MVHTQGELKTGTISTVCNSLYGGTYKYSILWFINLNLNTDVLTYTYNYTSSVDRWRTLQSTYDFMARACWSSTATRASTLLCHCICRINWFTVAASIRNKIYASITCATSDWHYAIQSAQRHPFVFRIQWPPVPLWTLYRSNVLPYFGVPFAWAWQAVSGLKTVVKIWTHTLSGH